jgi:hypothetical protein
MRPPHVARTRLGIVVGLLAILAATNRWLSWTAGIALVQGHDAPVYRQMALAAPHLPTGKVGNQHAQVFPLVYLVGLVAHIIGVNVDDVFRAVAVGVILAICLALHVALTRAQVNTPAYAVCMALFILNTYSLRYYLIVPGYFLDITFVLALAITLHGLITRRYWLALAGVVLATLTRQTALPMTLALAWWVVFGEGWRDASTAARVARGCAIIVVPVAVFVAMVAISAPFSYSDTPSIVGLTILGNLEQLPSTFGALVNHAVRVANSLFAVISLTGVTLLAWHRARVREKVPFEFIGCLVVGCSIALQAFLLNTNYSGHPERLTVLSLVSFVIGLAYLLRERERAGFKIPARTATLMIAILTVGSLQYLFTVVGPTTAQQGGVLQLVAAIVIGALLWRVYNLRPPSETAQGEPAGPAVTAEARGARLGPSLSGR